MERNGNICNFLCVVSGFMSLQSQYHHVVGHFHDFITFYCLNNEVYKENQRFTAAVQTLLYSHDNLEIRQLD